MGMVTDINKSLKLFRNDEDLLRLLYYAPRDLQSNQPDPLSDELDNILDKDINELWTIRDEHISTALNGDDLSDKKLCRIYVYLGRRRPANNNYTLAEQEIVVDILCHNDYQSKDQRTLRISDRINELLIGENVTGLSKMRYVEGYEFNPPKDYAAYRHVYETTVTKK